MSEYGKGPGCEGCKYLLREDTGYSNWTVMGTSVDCLKHLNPQLPLNDEDVESKVFNDALRFGETCETRVEGDGPWLDVDGETTLEDASNGDAEILAMLQARGR